MMGRGRVRERERPIGSACAIAGVVPHRRVEMSRCSREMNGNSSEEVTVSIEEEQFKPLHERYVNNASASRAPRASVGFRRRTRSCRRKTNRRRR